MKYLLEDKKLEKYKFKPKSSKYSSINGVVENSNSFWIMEPYKDFGDRDFYMEGSGYVWLFMFNSKEDAGEFIKQVKDKSIKDYKIGSEDHGDVLVESKTIDGKIIVELLGWDGENKYWEDNYILDIKKRIRLSNE